MKLYLVTVQKVYHQESENVIVTYNDWIQISAGKLYQFLSLEKHISKSRKIMISNHWRDLIIENAPLRAVVNGQLISVPEEFYDHILVKSIPDDNFNSARLIGKIFGNYDLGIMDSWYTLRIDQMIEANKLIVVENKDKSHPYGKVLKKV